MRTCITTTPIRPIPTTYPPFGSMAIIQSLRSIGEDVSFYNIDFFRYSLDEIEKYFKEQKFDVVGISAVVSTAYVFTKKLSCIIRKVSPDTKIIVGGNLAASAEILLRKTEIDFCVTGDGEIIIRELIAYLREKKNDYSKLKNIKGICYLDENDRFQFTGYGEKPSAEQIQWPDYSILEEDGSLPYFISDDIDNRLDGHSKKIQSGERLATVVMTKGCVARCTFCHRWEKGFRARPVDQVIDHIKLLKQKYNVNYIDIADENFGADRELTNELVTRLGELDIAWRCAGVRAKTVNKDMLAHWKANGCTSVIFGTESGSERILKIMEKNATVEENANALKWTSEVGLGTVIQLVIGMPGENDETIQETIDFLKNISTSLTWWKEKSPSELVSINFAQALPGTPLYEWAREQGYIGVSIDEEEKYLIKISDTDAYKSDHFINYTGIPLLKVLMWPSWILSELDFQHLPEEDRRRKSIYKIIIYFISFASNKMKQGWLQDSTFGKIIYSLIRSKNNLKNEYSYVQDSGYFNIRKGIKFVVLRLNPITNYLFFPLLAIATAVAKGKGNGGALKLIFDYFVWSIKGGGNKVEEIPSISLRKVIKIIPSNINQDSEDLMIPLRKGR